MLKYIMDAIRKHAAEEYPRECCGLVIQVGRKSQYIPCTNTATEPTEHFRLSGEEFAAAEEQGTVTMLVHSHPDCVEAVASVQDMRASDAAKLPYGIIAWPADHWSVYTPGETSLIGRAFQVGVSDCYSLVRAWHKIQGVDLADRSLPYPWWEDQYTEDLYRDYASEGFVDSPLVPGAMIIMQVSANKWNHAGIYLGNGEMLHHLYGHPSGRYPYWAQKGGYFVDRTVKIVRHKDLPPPSELKEWN